MVLLSLIWFQLDYTKSVAPTHGMEWDGMGWDGMGWDGMGWDGTRQQEYILACQHDK